MKRKALMAKLKAMDMEVETTETFYGPGGSAGGIWIKDGDGATNDRGHEPFNYYSWEWDADEEFYTRNTRNDVRAMLTKAGWFSEPYDSMTFMLWEI